MKRITLKKARLIANMTEEEVCTALRIRKDRLHAWETGKSVPSVEHAVAMAKAYDMPIDYLDFSKDANTPPAARKLTIEEIKALPFASVIWHSYVTNDNGVVWHSKLPVVIVMPGEWGHLAGSDEAGLFEADIHDNMFDGYYNAYWTMEPDDDMLPGITKEEYNNTPDIVPDSIVYPQLAEAITSRKITFERLSDMTGIKTKRIADILTGKAEIVQLEIVAIRTALNLSDDETMGIFFPESVGNVYDSNGRLIEPAAATQI